MAIRSLPPLPSQLNAIHIAFIDEIRSHVFGLMGVLSQARGCLVRETAEEKSFCGALPP